MIVKYLSEILPCCYSRNKDEEKKEYTRCGVCMHKILKDRVFINIKTFNTEICSYDCHIKWLHLKNHKYHYDSNHRNKYQ